jgi:pimeloyl-ACP methyl ester carboxylesterase
VRVSGALRTLTATVTLALVATLPFDAQARVGAVNGADGVRVAYDVRGTAQGRPSLVFVHGWSCDRSYWDAQMEFFSEDFRVVAVDLGGHGGSTFGHREAFTISSFGGDVATVVKALGLQRVILIGHSMGGDVVADAAKRLKGRVVGLVWLDTYSKLGSFRTPEQREALIAPFRADFAQTTEAFVRGMFPPTADKKLVDRVATDMASAPQQVALQSMESSFSNDRLMPGLLEELKLPVIAINPESSRTDRASMERYGVEVVEMPGVGHFLMMEAPDRFNPILRETLGRLGR